MNYVIIDLFLLYLFKYFKHLIFSGVTDAFCSRDDFEENILREWQEGSVIIIAILWTVLLFF